MKKFIAIAIAVLTVFSFTTVAFAESTTTLTTTVPDAEYTLNIPADQKIDFGAESTDIGSISVTNSSGFAVGKNLKVAISYDDFTCEDVNTKIPFTITLACVGTATETINVNSGDDIIFDGKDDGSVNQYIPLNTINFAPAKNTLIKINSTDWGKALAGNYTATITFTAEVVAA